MAETLNAIRDNYDRMHRHDLIRHCRAYSASLHDLSNEVFRLRMRLQLIDQHRAAIHGEPR